MRYKKCMIRLNSEETEIYYPIDFHSIRLFSIILGQHSIIFTQSQTHSHDPGRYFLFFLSTLLYNLWILFNFMRGIAGYGWITLMDFLISMSRGRWRNIMNDHG